MKLGGIPANAQIYPIRIASRRTRVNPRLIRAWEDIYHLITPARTEGGHRLFSVEDLNRIREIRTLRSRGVSLKGMQRLLNQRRKPRHRRSRTR
jgi:DNA-binding transcriptional MerR regulator